MVLLVYSVTDYESFDSLSHWARELEENAEGTCIKFVVGSKIDDTEGDDGETVPKQVGLDYAK